jgi:O-antigen/teichoic acid export membrane protein
VRWTAVGAVARALLQVAQLGVLARWVMPADYGLMAIVSAVLGFAALFVDLGVNSAYVQRQSVSAECRSSLFWFSVVVSASATVVVMAVSPLLAFLFGAPRLTPVLMISASTLVVGALGVQIKMSAEKALRFRPVVVVEVIAAVAGFGVAVLLAVAGLGVYALVLSAVASTAVGSGLAWIVLFEGWWPTWRLRMDEVRSFLGFGSAVVLSNCVNHVNSNVDLFLGGRSLSAESFGLYSVPRNLALQIQFVVNPILTRVGFPMIAEVQADLLRVKAIYLQTLRMAMAVSAPVYVGVACFACEIIELLMGSNWSESAKLLRLLAMWCALRAALNPAGSLLLGMGRAGRALQWNLGLLVVTPPVVWLGSFAGAEGIAWAMLALMVALFVPSWRWIVWPLCQVGLVEYTATVVRPIASAFLSVILAWLLVLSVDGSGLRLSCGVLVSVPLYLSVSWVFNRKAAREMLSVVGWEVLGRWAARTGV